MPPAPLATLCDGWADMPASLQQLLDGLTVQAATRPFTTIEDVTGALGHLGRALTGLAQDGLTAAGSVRQQTVARLSDACSTVGGLWPHTGGPLSDLAGAAADLIGRERISMGRAQRWAVTVEVAAAANQGAGLAQQLLPNAAVREFAAVRTLAGAVERDAQCDPPAVAAAAILDRLVPPPGPPHQRPGLAPAEASAGLVAALARARRDDQLSLRELRVVVAVAVVASRDTALVAAALTEETERPWEATAAAWRATGQATMAFEDGRRGAPADPRTVSAWAKALVDAVRRDLGPSTEASILRQRADLARMAAGTGELANQLPVLAGELSAAVDRWARTGQLYAYARDLPPMENMPEDRVREVIAGRRVQARGPDLDHLRHAIGRAATLSTSLADAVNRATAVGLRAPGHPAGTHTQHVAAPGSPDRLLDQAQTVAQALAATRFPLSHTPGGVHHFRRDI